MTLRRPVRHSVNSVNFMAGLLHESFGAELQEVNLPKAIVLEHEKFKTTPTFGTPAAKWPVGKQQFQCHSLRKSSRSQLWKQAHLRNALEINSFFLNVAFHRA